MAIKKLFNIFSAYSGRIGGLIFMSNGKVRIAKYITKKRKKQKI